MNNIKINLPLIKAMEQNLIPTSFSIVSSRQGDRVTNLSFDVLNENGEKVDTLTVNFLEAEHNAIIDILSSQLPLIIQAVQQKLGVPADKLEIPAPQVIAEMFKWQAPQTPPEVNNNQQ